MIDHREKWDKSLMTWNEFETQQNLLKKLRAKETDFELVKPDEQQLSIERGKAIGLGEQVCPLCESRTVIWPLVRSRTTGEVFATALTCRCVYYKQYYSEFYRNVHAHDRGILLRSIAPSAKSRLSTTYQEQMIAHLKQHPNDSYAFFGPAGTSKTTYSIALYQKALATQAFRGELFIGSVTPSVIRVSAKSLLDQFVAEATSESGRKEPQDQPLINARKLQRIVKSKRVPRLFLEEIDKVKYTDFKTNCLFEVIDGIYQHEGQLVFDTNITLAEMSELFVGATGEALMRRISEMCKIYDFFKEVE